MKEVAIKVEGLGKQYEIGKPKDGDFRNFVQRGFKNIFKKSDDTYRFWALSDLNFEVTKGEALGIIGRNGSGKSTLLKLLSRITFPTTGRYEITGRVSSLLEVGTGFHPELSGRENIYLNGTILGMKRSEIKAKFDEIVEFSGTEKFIDTAIKHYSSGMKVRLAFSVAAHLEPEILIIDEVLAVGDAEFQKKCLGKMDEVSRGNGRTVLFVSHDMNAIQKLCSSAILLQDGKIEKAGTAEEVIAFYQTSMTTIKKSNWENNAQNDSLNFKTINVVLSGSQPRLTLTISFSVESSGPHSPSFTAFDIVNSRGVTIMQILPRLSPFITFKEERQLYECKTELLGLVPDTYYLTAWIGAHNTDTYDLQNEIVNFEVIESPTIGRTFPHTADHGAIAPPSEVSQIFIKN